MCTGVEIALLAAGAAASAGGALISRNESQQNAARIAQARNAELRDSIARQRRYEDKSRTEGVQKVLSNFSPDEQAKQFTADEARRDAAISSAVTPTQGVGDIPLPTGNENAPTVVKDNIAKRLRDVFNTATDRAKLAAKPLTYADMLAGNNIPLTEAGRLVDTNNSFSRQEAAMLPNQQDFAAYMAQRAPSIWGPLLQTVGTTLAAGAGSGYLKASQLAKTASDAAGAAIPTATATTYTGAPLSYLDVPR